MSIISTSVCLLVVSMTCAAPAAAQDEPTLRPFRSELWQLEYREDDEQRELPFDEGGGGKGGGSSAQRKSLALVDLNSPIGDPSLGIGSVSVPGDATIDQITSEVPIADMQFQAASSMSGPVYEASISDWEMRSIGAGVRRGALTSSSDGPSIITVLVGLVACIVMIGAFLTGRE